MQKVVNILLKYLVAEECTSCNWLTCPRQPQRKRGIHFHIFFYISQKPTALQDTTLLNGVFYIALF